MTRGRKFEATGTIVVAAGVVVMVSGSNVLWGPPLMLLGLTIFVVGRFLS